MQSFAVIPAAGRSQRMGRPKLLLPWGSKTVIEHVLGTWRASRVDQIVMVVHPDDASLAEIGRRCGATVVRPDRPPAEMKASVCIALAHIEREFGPDHSDGWLMAPADMPTLERDTIDRLLEAYRASLDVPSRDRPIVGAPSVVPPTIWVPSANGRRGHPVLFPWSLAPEVSRLGAGDGLNALLARHPVRTIEVTAEAIPQDLDTPDDYGRLRPRDAK